MLNQSGVIPPPESWCQSAEGVWSPVQGVGWGGGRGGGEGGGGDKQLAAGNLY